MTRIWDRFLTAQDKEYLTSAGPRPAFGFGTSAAVLSIDNYRGAIGDVPMPLLTSIQTWPGSTGMSGWVALEKVDQLIETARQTSIPVIHVTALAEEDSGIAGWSRPRGERARLGAAETPDAEDGERHRRRYDFVEQAAPRPGEAVIRKTAPSAFFGTPLAAHLSSLRIDTLIVCGESTSGCVRATVVDARSYRFNVVVVEDAVYDRHEASHAINLFDMQQKYADVLRLTEVATWMTSQAKPARTS